MITKNTREIYDIKTTLTTKLRVSLYRSSVMDKGITILYFHGGGLLYGVREDLPEEYISLFLKNGYNLLAFDYPLAPEAPLSMIVQSVQESFQWFKNEASTLLGIDSSKFFLFGRSAGGYLCYLLSKYLMTSEYNLPLGIISFYSYYGLEEKEFYTPSSHYLKLPKIPESILSELLSPEPITHGPISSRFSIYVYGRQTGTWLKLLGIPQEEVKNYSLTEEELSNLPPIFLTASTTDQDVPYRVSKRLSKALANATLHTVYGLDHDFDRDIKNKVGYETYEKLILWMDRIVGNCS
ncbi:alpha/beta hydrolase [Alloiococcus sp. CFN-8]|uniref:alpha/beta hydrolase n=1 Tax=Alloiococcus sp. CFN-8 TaxID=3416081 RepID=UPI003CE95FAF